MGHGLGRNGTPMDDIAVAPPHRAVDTSPADWAGADHSLQPS
ncbi:hypothetical protein [Streptomyces sp. NPDC001286]